MFRLLALFVLTGALAVSGYHRKRARGKAPIARAAEPRWLIAARLAISLPFLIVFLTWLVRPPVVAWATMPVGNWIRWLGLGIGLAAIVLVQWVLRNLGANVSETVLTKSGHELVESGPYRWVRHPLYSTGLLLLLALSLMAANWFMLAWTGIAACFFRLVVTPIEEQRLIDAFGDRYRAYQARTGRLLPRRLLT